MQSIIQYVINKLCMILCNKLHIILYNTMVIRIVYNLRAAAEICRDFLPYTAAHTFLRCKKAPTPLKQGIGVD